MNKKILFVLFLTIVLVSNVWSQADQLKYYTTRDTSLTNEDILRFFVNEVRLYLQRHDSYNCSYLVEYNVNKDKDEQDSAWKTITWEFVYPSRTLYDIILIISNARITVTFCNTSFLSGGGRKSMQIITTRSDTLGGREIRNHIISTAAAMFNESEMVLKMNNDKYSDETKTAFLTQMMRILL